MLVGEIHALRVFGVVSFFRWSGVRFPDIKPTSYVMTDGKRCTTEKLMTKAGRDKGGSRNVLHVVAPFPL